MTNKTRAGVVALSVAVMLNPFFSAQAATAPLCESSGYTLGFFNGVWNTGNDAQHSLEQLARLLPPEWGGKEITTELFYNHTGCNADGSTCLRDIAEVFIQRSNEIDTSGVMAAHLELFWETLSSGSLSLGSRIVGLFSAAATVFDDMRTRARTLATATLASLVSNPPTARDRAAHDTRLDALALQNQMLLLVGHSQGNLFLNQAYDHIVPTIGSGSVRAVQVAPASVTLRGPHLLADVDLVIGALGVAGLGPVPPANLSLPFSRADLSGHALVDTYLDAERPGREAVKATMNTALAELVPSSAATQSAGSFTVTLTWSGSGDEDLHVIEPGGSHVFYAMKQGRVGYLDTDNTRGLGPEHYFASCNAQVLMPGRYEIGLNNYRDADNQIATLQVATPGAGAILTRQLDTGPTRGAAANDTPIPAAAVTVTKDAATGRFSITAE